MGVINSEGEVVIECNHKSIKLITKDILLVENSSPTSPSVIEAVKLRKDPLAATNLVSTTATIKDKMAVQMGADGRFLFNDQFSEATLFDLDGKNLLQDKYYSFISINKAGDTLYLCENTKESNVDTFSLVTMTFNDSTTVPETTEVPESNEELVDISEVNVDKNDIDTAMNEVEEQVIPTPEVPSDVEEINNDEENTEEVEEAPVEEIPLETEDTTDQEKVDDIKSIIDNVTENEPEEVEEAIVPVEEEEAFNNLENFDNEIPAKIEENGNDFDNLLLNSNFDYGNNTYQESDLSDLEDDSLFDKSKNLDASRVDGIMNDAANTLSKLIDANKNQQTEINNYKDQVRELTTLNKRVVDKARHDRDMMKSSIDNYESEIDRLKEELEALEDRVHEKERIISSQNSELSDLRVQMEGRKNLEKLLEDAESLLGNSNY